MSSIRYPPPESVFDIQKGQNPPLRSPDLGVRRAHNLHISRRTSFDQSNVCLYGWPSRGGIIVLENATPPDFEYLHLNPLDPPLRRDPEQGAEDEFCRGLLRLGATWWDSEARRDFVKKLEHGHEEAIEAVYADESLAPTKLEQTWMRIAWPSDPAGALCVLVRDKPIMGRSGDLVLPPKNHLIISLARTMDERCELLRKLGGKMYDRIEDVDDPRFLRAWEDEYLGEKGGLKKYEFNDPNLYGGHPDDALGRFGPSNASTNNSRWWFKTA